MSGKFYASILITMVVFGCTSEKRSLEPALNSIVADDMKNYISVLASDDFEGRAPSTPGETKTINYLAEQFEKIGLKPANNGSYFQEVSLVKITADPSMKLKITGDKQNFDLKFSDEFIGGTPQLSENVLIDNSEIIFVGYGINSPEYNWNDYSGLNVKGKTVLMLVNDPGYATGDIAEREAQVLRDHELTPEAFQIYPELTSGTRRPYVIFPSDLEVHPEAEGLRFRFSLPSGCYATVLLREFQKTPVGEP